MTKLLTALSFIFFTFLVGPNSHAQNVEFIFDGSGCNGFLGRMKSDSDTVYLFTAGHCIPGVLDSENPNKILLNSRFDQPKKFLAYNAKNPNKTIGIKSSGILLATFQNVDVAILEVSKTFGELKAEGIEPYLIGQGSSGNMVELSNVLTNESATCALEISPALLTYQEWTWSWAIRLSKQCLLKEGWSGAAVVKKDSGNVLGILSGGNETGTCDDYCEIDRNGHRKGLKDISYFTSLRFLSTCTSKNGKINPDRCTVYP